MTGGLKARIGALLATAVLIASCATDAATPAPACRDDLPAPQPASSDPPGPVEVRFLGTTSLLLDDGQTQILIDGFFSRPPLWRALIGWIGPDETRIDAGLLAAGVAPRLAAIFVAHGHHDHALDAPWIARTRRIDLIGSEGVCTLGRGQQVPRERLWRAGPERRFAYGAFQVETIPAPHSTPELFPGPIREPFSTPAWAPRWRTGGANFAFLITHGDTKILLHPSAAFVRSRYRGIQADLVFLGLAGVGRKDESFARDYWQAVVRDTQARFVVPVHWDNFGHDLAEGLRPMPWPLDRVAEGRRRIGALAEGCVTVLDLGAYDQISAEQLRREHPERAVPLTARCRGAEVSE